MGKDTSFMINNLMGLQKSKFDVIDYRSKMWTFYDNETFRIIISHDDSSNIVINKLTHDVFRNITIAYNTLNISHQEAFCSSQAQSLIDSMD